MDKIRETIQKISETAESLQEPKDYYNAVRTQSSIKPPDNIQMVYRWCNQPMRAEGHNLYHRRYVLNLVLEGPGKVCINDEMFDLEQDSLLLLFPFQFHYYTARDKYYKWLIITFDEVEPIPVELRCRPVKLTQFGYTLVQQILETYLEYEKTPLQTLSLKLSTCVNCLLNEMRDIARLNPVPKQVIRNTKMMLLERICGYINHHLAESLTVYQLARKHGISEGYLSVLFSRLIGCGPGEYIRNSRINRAVNMLNSGNYLISEVAENTGFSSPAVFSRTFRAVIGTSPREFIKQ
jgi:AraC-like DNA-binding protein